MTTTRPSLRSIPQIPAAHYEVWVPWKSLERTIAADVAECGLDLAPDFQRGHVWTDTQATRYVEYRLRGGRCASTLIFNCYQYGTGRQNPYVIVDGLQRLTAVRRFMADELPAYGRRLSEYADTPNHMDYGFQWSVTGLPTRAEVLRFYLDLNDGGSVHAESELARVRSLLAAEPA